MSTIYAKSKSRLVLFIVYPGVTLLDVSGPAQVFSSANTEMSADSIRYETVVASLEGGLVVSDTGIEINTKPLAQFRRKKIDTIIVAGGEGVFDAAENATIVDWLARTMPRARRAVSTCMGVFLTAETGLLKSKTVTTHWRWTDKLQARYPELDVVTEPIYVKQGSYMSSAGVTSGIDLSLRLVEEDHNRRTALAVAKQLVLYLRRTGAQSQFSSSLLFQFSQETDRFENLNSWIDQNLNTELTVDVLAERVGMSPRNFSRLYTEHVGHPPAKAVERLRVEKARMMIETTAIPIKTISAEVGFKTYERMRRSFVRLAGISPADYRERFGIKAGS